MVKKHSRISKRDLKIQKEANKVSQAKKAFKNRKEVNQKIQQSNPTSHLKILPHSSYQLIQNRKQLLQSFLQVYQQIPKINSKPKIKQELVPPSIAKSLLQKIKVEVHEAHQDRIKILHLKDLVVKQLARANKFNMRRNKKEKMRVIVRGRVLTNRIWALLTQKATRRKVKMQQSISRKETQATRGRVAAEVAKVLDYLQKQPNPPRT